MPDNSVECDLILRQLSEIKEQLTSLANDVTALKLERAERAGEHKAHAAIHFALARIGSVVVGCFALVGWLVTGDHWTEIKKLFQ